MLPCFNLGLDTEAKCRKNCHRSMHNISMESTGFKHKAGTVIDTHEYGTPNRQNPSTSNN